MLLFRVAFLGFLFCLGCTSSEQKELQQATEWAQKQNYVLALHTYEQILRKTQKVDIQLKAAREAARISLYELKRFAKAIDFYQIIVLKSTNPQERQWAQKQKASIYFDHLQDYDKAIVEYNKLLGLPHDPEEEAQIRLTISRSYYYLNAFAQAYDEIKWILKDEKKNSVYFDALTLYGNILLAQKKFKEATVVFLRLLDEYPDRSLKENIIFMLALCYEENEAFKQAIDLFEKYKDKMPQKEYVELRIKRLKERQKNAPGAKGFRK